MHKYNNDTYLLIFYRNVKVISEIYQLFKVLFKYKVEKKLQYANFAFLFKVIVSRIKSLLGNFVISK